MRYAQRADDIPHTSATKLEGKSFGAGAGHYGAEGDVIRSGTKTPIRIFTLGRFCIAIDGWATRSGGKARHRPLSLLQALIALGGRDIAVGLLCECLWPDSEGDLGGRNLNITVHRLRHMLQAREAVLQHDGKLTLNEKVCWVDAWEFERSVNSGLDRSGNNNGNGSREVEAHLRTALGLYAGQFLARESEEPWMLAPRLRLQTKFERLVSMLSMHLEHQMRFPESIEICLRGLELDPLNELMYRRLMSCYLKRGEFASVMSAYRRCREALSKGLSASVSCETERLYFDALKASQGVMQTAAIATSFLVHRDAAHQRALP
jgi:LuxR family maltose regulon positive regulatory protein